MPSFYIDTASTAGGDGTSDLLSGSTRAFASMNEARNTLNTLYGGSLVTGAIGVVTIYCRASTGVQDTAPSSPDGVDWDIITDASNYFRILPYPGDEPAMPWVSTIYRLVQANSFFPALKIDTVKFELGGIQIETTGTRANENKGVWVVRKAGGNVSIHHNYIRATGGGAAGNANAGVHVTGAANGTIRIYENFFVAWSRGILMADTGDQAEVNIIDANTFVDSVTTAIRFVRYGTNTYRIRNNVATGGTATQFSFGGSGGTLTTGGNRSSDASSPDAAGQSVTITFVNAGTGDYHLDPTDVGAVNAGGDLTADPYNPHSTDFEGDTRPSGSAWDSGADQMSGTGGPTYHDITDVVLSGPYSSGGGGGGIVRLIGGGLVGS